MALIPVGLGTAAVYHQFIQLPPRPESLAWRSHEWGRDRANVDGHLQLSAELQSTLRRWHPEYEWIVTPQFVKEFDDGGSLSAYGSAAAHFLIIAGNSRLVGRELRPLLSLSCDGEEYRRADDPERWLRRAAGQILGELRAKQGNEAAELS